MTKLIQDYRDGEEDRLQQGWDYVQAQVGGWGLSSVRSGPVCIRVSGSSPPCACTRLTGCLSELVCECVPERHGEP